MMEEADWVKAMEAEPENCLLNPHDDEDDDPEFEETDLEPSGEDEDD